MSVSPWFSTGALFFQSAAWYHYWLPPWCTTFQKFLFWKFPFQKATFQKFYFQQCQCNATFWKLLFFWKFPFFTQKIPWWCYFPKGCFLQVIFSVLLSYHAQCWCQCQCHFPEVPFSHFIYYYHRKTVLQLMQLNAMIADSSLFLSRMPWLHFPKEGRRHWKRGKVLMAIFQMYFYLNFYHTNATLNDCHLTQLSRTCFFCFIFYAHFPEVLVSFFCFIFYDTNATGRG